MTMLLLPGNATRLIQELNGANPTHYGWLLTPRRTFTKQSTHGLRYAVDNDRYSMGDQWKPDVFFRAILRIREAHSLTKCLFVLAPDTPYDAPATLRQFQYWGHVIRALGFPVALAAQDGLENLPIPWSHFDALFIGGSTDWKLGSAATDLIRESKERGKWTHVGRVNSTFRASRLIEPPDSVDGTAWAKHPAHYAKQWRRWINARQPQFTATLWSLQ